MNRQTRDEQLRRLLREADPAADDPGLSREEIRHMRRTVLSAVSEPRRRWGFAPLLMGAATAILLLVLGWTLWLGGFSTAPSRQPVREAVVPPISPSPIFTVQPAAPTLRVTSEKPAAPRSATHRRRPASRKPAAPRTSSPGPVAIAEAETHQIQFSTPGGTRIIWVLTANQTTD